MPTRAHCMTVARDPTTGAALLSATVNVYNPGTTSAIGVTIYDKNGNVLSNPLTSDASTGLIDFYLNVSQEVDLVVSKNGYTTRTYSNVPVLDDASYEMTALLTTTGDLAYASSANTPTRLAIGSTGAFLTVTGGVPAWSNTIAAGGLTITAGGLTVTAGNAGIGIAPQTYAGLYNGASITVSSGGSQYGQFNNPTLTAQNNGDLLVGFYGIGSYVVNSKTGTTAVAIRAVGPTSANATNYAFYLDSPSGASTNVVIGSSSGASLTTAGAWTNNPSWSVLKEAIRDPGDGTVSRWADWIRDEYKPKHYRYKSERDENGEPLGAYTDAGDYDHFGFLLDDIPQDLREVICANAEGGISTKDTEGLLLALVQECLRRIG